MTDLTKLKLAESSPRDTTSQQEAIANTVLDSIVVIDDTGIVQSANPATEAIFGYSAGELVGRNIKVVMPEEVACTHDGCLSAYKRTAVRKVIGIGREVTGKRKDGSTFPLDLSVAEWHDAAGRRFYTGIMRDISERKKTEEALSHAQRLDAVGRLAGGVAHDMNNLLAVIAGNLEIAEQRTQDQETRQLIRRAMEAVEAGTSFNRRLLSLAQRRKLAPHRLALNARVEHMVELIERTLGEDVELHARLAEDLWDVHCDPGEFDSALVNLAINARDAMPEGGRLEIAARNVALDANASRLHPDARPGFFVGVSVIDTGTGMTPEVLKRAIDPFFTTKEPGKGTGLGLSSLHSFVRQSGGFVTLASEPGKGTIVNFYLPRASNEPATEHAASVEEIPQGDGELILVVEDDDPVREITLKRLESLGYAVAEARSAPEAIKLLESGEPIDLVFSDVVMPGRMTGYDLARWIAAMKPNIKVVLTTGYNDGDAKADASPVGVKIPVLDKPYSREKLAQTMRRALLDQPA
jgi:PAS domain S-box-containing protein